MSGTIYYPLTSPQLSIWYTERMYSGTSISNVAGTLRIKDKVDIEILKKAINLFIKNNDGIRLRICLDDEGNPQQYVAEYVYKEIEAIDFSGFEDPAKAMREWDRQETLKPFELLNSELFRFVIIKLNDSDTGFYILTHHIISDAWNMSLLGSSIVDYYCRIIKDPNDESLHNVMPSYTAFTENEQFYLKSERYEKDKKYWEQIFETAPETTFLKVRQTNEFSTKTKRKTFIAPKKFTNKLREYCQENKITPYPLFLSAIAMYINRITDKEDVILGTPILNRLNRTDKNTVGMFVSTIPLRINVNSNNSFLDLSHEVLDLCLSSYRHQRYPYDHVLKYVREKHNIKENLYDIVLSYQNSKFDKSFDVEYITRWHFNENQSNSFTMHINDRDGEGVLIIDYDYHADLYYDKEIEFIHQHVLSLLWHALDNPKNLICKIEMLTENEKKRILHDFNDTCVDYPREKTIHQLFEEQVEKTPDNIAVVFEDKKLTYKELNQKANSLAILLREKGVKQDEKVGIMVNRSLELIIGILAILKAGGAFMPIEPDLPFDRVKYMIEESNTKVILSSKDIICSNNYGVDSIDIFSIPYHSQDADNLKHNGTSDNLAYVIFTSGSTGKPKGVMIKHNSLHNFVRSMFSMFEYDSSSIVLSVASICFDLFIMEVIPPLLCGAKLILANSKQQKIPALFKNLIIKNHVTAVLFTPSRMKLLLEDENHECCLKNLKTIMLGGENLERQLLRKLKKITNARIINAYGPTEVTIAATFQDLTNNEIITIGKPINNTRILILDKHLNLVPIGIPGEIYIAGEGLARGYTSNEKLTNEVFITNPYNECEKMYKTGDIARWFPKGEISFIGRGDNQVKIRGYRIELGEIEQAILSYQGIKDAAVTVKKNSTFEDFLCAYIVCDNIVSVNEIKAFISKMLPKYMIPKFIIEIDSIPLNASGKRDYSRLPDIDNVNILRESIVSPSNKTEEIITNVLCKLMKLEAFSVLDNIFEYGADSLTIIQLVSYLDREGYNISIEDVYNNPTIRGLSRFLENTQLESRKNKINPLNYNNITEDITALIDNGKLQRLDSAALSYVPDESIQFPNDYAPILYNYIKTSLGNIGVFCLPISGKELYRDNDKLLRLCGKAIEQAKNLGAKTVSLTGLIPSATNYGIDIIDKISPDIQITTGHATTAASVILSLERLLLESNRDIHMEKIVVLGMGSVGSAVAELLLSVYPRIRNITICDLHKKSKELCAFKEKLQKNHKTEINIVYAEFGKIPKDIYESTLIIGATNVSNVIDVDLLKPGTLIIDDSGPHCFSYEQAVNRLIIKGDILFTEGGVLNSAETMQKYTYLPEFVNKDVINKYNQFFDNDRSITGCILSSLLTTKFKNILPTVGTVTCSDSFINYHVLKKNGYFGAVLHCDGYVIPEKKIYAFGEKYGLDIGRVDKVAF